MYTNLLLKFGVLNFKTDKMILKCGRRHWQGTRNLTSPICTIPHKFFLFLLRRGCKGLLRIGNQDGVSLLGVEPGGANFVLFDRTVESCFLRAIVESSLKGKRKLDLEASTGGVIRITVSVRLSAV